MTRVSAMVSFRISRMIFVDISSSICLKIFFLMCVLFLAGIFWTEKMVLVSDHGAMKEQIDLYAEINRRNNVVVARDLLQGRKTERKFKEGKLVINQLRHVICPYFMGGLGNLLFQYSSAYGISRKVGLDVVVNADSKMFQIFDIWANITCDKKVCSKAKLIHEKKSGVFNKGFMELTPNKNYTIKGYLQSWKYFEPYKDDIRRQLRFRGDIEKKAYDILSSVLTTKYGKGKYSSRTLVGVHVRRGDFLKPGKQEYGIVVADKSFIDKALAYFIKKYHEVTFLVCSIDMKWSKANVIGSDVIFIEGNPAEVDLAILSSLNHTIVTVGTFGWWSAWLANGTTLYFKDFVKNGTDLASKFDPDHLDHIYPSWIGM